VKKVDARLSFEVEPSEHLVIAVDERVVKRGVRPVYVWVAVDTYNYEVALLSGSRYHSPARKT